MDHDRHGTETATTSVSRFPCSRCHRTYERQDHLSRHLKSHDNERRHKCGTCGKGFRDRVDLLNRHREAHLREDSSEHLRRRTSKACESCIQAKTKCEEERPCKRCRTRGTPCIPTDRLQPRASDAKTEPDSISGSIEDDAARTILDLSQSADLEEVAGTLESSLIDQPTGMADASLLMDEFAFADFFDSIMYGESTQSQQMLQPPDISNFMQDFDLNTFDFDFGLLDRGLTRPPTPQGSADAGAGTFNVPADTPRSDAELRSQAFEKSPWSWSHWIPPASHTSFSGFSEINIPEERVHSEDQLTPQAKTAHIELGTEARDRLLRLISQMGDSRVTIAIFPSLQLLQDLLNVFSVQESIAIDNFLHTASFETGRAQTVLLLATIASGSTYVSLAPVWRMGMVMQEVVRVAVGAAIERDNSMTRDLQHLQAWLLMLSVGIWSGFRRKTEVASAFLQTSVTMLMWQNAFSRTRYRDIVPSWNDTDEELNVKWNDWIQQESLKRLCIRYFIHDSQVSIAHLQNPLISPAQLMLALPAAKPLWTAQNAQSWRNHFLSSRQLKDSQLPSSMALASNIRLLDSFDGLVDKGLSTMVACYTMAYDVFHFRQQARLLSHGQTRPRHDRLLAHHNRQREIYEDLSSMHTYCELQPRSLVEALFTLEYLMMSLHVSLDDIQLFSGRSGEGEARRVFPQIRAWAEDSTSRITVWHAGQVIRMARSLERTRLRDFYAVATYHATLTLWVYGLVTSNAARRSRAQTPVTGPSTATQLNSMEAHEVFLDGQDDRAAKAFRHLGHGRPCLSNMSSDYTAATYYPLEHSKGIMLLSANVLKSNFPKSAGLPPLVENLVNLMTELSKLSGRVST